VTTLARTLGGVAADMLDEYFRQYALIAIFVAVAAVVPVGMLVASWALSLLKIRPYAPDPIKKAIYECGFETLSGRWSQFNFRFYTFALIFVVFDVEVVFLFPWAASFGLMSAQFGAFVLVEMLVFVAILVVGWLYAWRKGSLEWS
jgi:NADH:ubiquinone oxidoreductase subunit 3 (subunit A)